MLQGDSSLYVLSFYHDFIIMIIIIVFFLAAEHVAGWQLFGGQERPLLHREEAHPGQQESAGQEREPAQTPLMWAPTTPEGEQGQRVTDGRSSELHNKDFLLFFFLFFIYRVC